MIAGSIGKRYAKALLEIAQEQSKVEEVFSQLEAFSEALYSSREMRNLLEDPFFTSEQRKQFLLKISSSLSLNQTVKNFLFLLVDRGRLPFFDEILRAYQKLADEVLNRVQVSVKSAQVFSEGFEKLLKEKLESMTHKQVMLHLSVDPDLLGGMILQVDNTLLDGSLKTTLTRLKQSLLEASLN